MTLLTALAYWVGICFAAALGCIVLLWLGYRLFEQAEEGMDFPVPTSKYRCIQSELARLDAEVERFSRTAASASSLSSLKDNVKRDSYNAWLRWSSLKDRQKAIEARLDAIEALLKASEPK